MNILRLRLNRYSLAAFFAVFVMTFSGATALASTPPPDPNTGSQPTTSAGQDACNSLSNLNTDQGCGKGQSVINKVINSVVNFISYLAGVLAIIIVMVAGFQFITANGDSNNIARARRSLAYAAIGLVIATVAQLMVHFVLSASTACPYNSNLSIGDSACVAPKT